MKRVLAVAADPASTITRIRIAEPLSTWLDGEGGVLRMRPLHDMPLEDLVWCEVLVVQRGLTRRDLRLMRTAAAMGRTVIYEIDDLLTDPAPQLQHARALQRGARWVRAALGAADMVTVSTERLGRLLALPPERNIVVPNAAFAFTTTGPSPAPQRAGAPVTVLVAASDRVAGAAAWQALRALATRRAGAPLVLAVGPVADDLTQAGVPCHRLAQMPREAFVRWAAAQPNPLALIPLDQSRFSSGKSAIKWFDYALAGVPTLASCTPPYSEVLEHGRTGWLVGPSVAEWEAALAAAVADADMRGAVATSARAHVLEHHHAGLTQQAWGWALERAAALAAARLGGAPTSTPPPRLRSALDQLSLVLRRWNRERLARRQ